MEYIDEEMEVTSVLDNLCGLSPDKVREMLAAFAQVEANLRCAVTMYGTRFICEQYKEDVSEMELRCVLVDRGLLRMFRVDGSNTSYYELTNLGHKHAASRENSPDWPLHPMFVRNIRNISLRHLKAARERRRRDSSPSD